MGLVIPFGRPRTLALMPTPSSRPTEKASQSTDRGIEAEIASIKTELRWIIIVGSLAGFVFGWLFTVYLPEKIQTAKSDIRSELSERLARVEDGVASLDRDVRRLEQELKEAEATLTKLRIKPAELRSLPAAQISKIFGGVIDQIDDALAKKMPPASANLAADKKVVTEAISYRGRDKNVYEKGVALLGRLDGFEAFGRAIAERRADLFFSGGGMSAPEATNPFEGTVLLQVPPNYAGLAVVFRAEFQGGRQDLTSVKWIGDQFTKTIVTYSGGPLYLSDVSFVDCKFNFSGDETSQRVRAILEGAKGKRVSVIVSPEYSSVGSRENH